MVDTIPMPLGPVSQSGPATRPFAASQPATHTLPLTFSGSGSEYFRIWIVNLLLMLVTLGLYYPWAKVRRLRYFYGNTAVGEHPLDFHGEPKRMLRGFLLVAALVLLYSVAGRVSPVAGLIAFLIVAAIWPALFRASMRFRMANTSWRGLRFRFNGDLGSAYRAMLPLFVPSALTLLAVLIAGDPSEARPEREPGAPGFWIVAPVLLAFVLLPWFMWALKKYQHDHYALGQVQTQLGAGAGSFYLLALKSVGVILLTAIVAGIGVALVGGGGAAFALMMGSGSGKGSGAGTVAAVVAIVVAIIMAYVAIIVVLQPYLTSRLQNMVWGRTASRHVRFESTLRFWPLLGLTLKNWLLIVITLGFYWPFARIAMARMRLQAVTVHTLLAPDDLVSTLRERADDAAGDAAGDLFGIDIGW